MKFTISFSAYFFEWETINLNPTDYSLENMKIGVFPLNKIEYAVNSDEDTNTCEKHTYF